MPRRHPRCAPGLFLAPQPGGDSMRELLERLSDAELVARIDRGDAEAFEVLYHRHRERLFAIAWRYTGDVDDAADVLQEAFSWFLGKFPGFRLRARFATLLHPVLRHLARDLRARRDRRAARPLDTVDLPAPEPDEPSDPRAALARVLRVLPLEQREVLLMRFVDDLSLAEIAAALAVPLGTVKSRLHQALAVLRADPRTRRSFGAEGPPA